MPPEPDSLAAFLTCLLIDAGLARLSLDWLDGPVLRDRRGETVPVDDFAASILETGASGLLAEWLVAR